MRPRASHGVCRAADQRGREGGRSNGVFVATAFAAAFERRVSRPRAEHGATFGSRAAARNVGPSGFIEVRLRSGQTECYDSDMIKDADRLLQEALQLPPNERAKIATELLSSLDRQDEEVKAAWAAEIIRRAADAETDPDDEEDWRSALEDIRREVLAR